MSGPNLDLTNGNIRKLVLKMAVPASIGYFFNTMYNLVDTYFGGQISTNALAALSLSFPVFALILAISTGVYAGASALMANALGAGDIERAIKYQKQAVSLGVIISVVATAILFPLLKPIFTFMGADSTTLVSALRYARVLVLGGIFFTLINVLNAGLYSRGDTKTYRNYLIVSFFLNVGLDPLLLFGLKIRNVVIIPAMYESGIALATVSLQVLGVLYIARRAVKAGAFGPTEKIKFSDFIPNREYVRELLGQSLPQMMSMLTMALGTFVITYFVSKFGTNAVAAYGSGLRIEQIALIPTIGLNIALGTLVGQNNGAGKLDRVSEAFKTTLLYGLVVMVGILTPVLIFARSLLGIFTEDAEVIRLGASYLFIQAITFYSYVILFQANSLLQGLKKPAMIMWSGLYRQIPAPIIIFPLFINVLGLGIQGVWWGLVVVNWSAAIIVLIFALAKLKEAMRLPIQLVPVVPATVGANE
jgi:putative MATE family efflux protein